MGVICIYLTTFYLQELPKPGEPVDAASTAWSWRSNEADFSVTFPSDRWQEYKTPNERSKFAQRLPAEMIFSFLTVKTRASEEDFAKVDHFFRRIIDKSKPENPKFEKGETPTGNPFIDFISQEQHEKGMSYLASRILFLKEKKVVVHAVFEGTCTKQSQAWKDAEWKLFEETSSFILKSIQ